MWIVWSRDDGVLCITDDREKAVSEYEETKQWYKDMFDGEFDGDERVILAKVEKVFCCHDTGKPVIEYDDEGNEIELKDETYWDWKEDTF